MITSSQAKKIIKEELDRRNLTYTKLSAKTNSLGLFVYVEGWKPDPQWENIEQAARQNGFHAMTRGDVF